MQRKNAFFLIVLLMIAAGIAAYLITGKPVELGEVSGQVVKVTTLTQETDAKAEVLIALDDGRQIRVLVGAEPRPAPGTRLLLMEYKAEKRDIRSFKILGETQ